MGNDVSMQDLPPVRDDERRELNLGRKVTHKQYTKHISGEHSDACLTELPWSIRDAVSLYERMDVSFNSLTEIPIELPLRLPHLSYLNLSNNLLASLPESIGLLFHLQTAILCNNNLRQIPKSFVRLVKLEKVDLSNNLLRELPADLGDMESLARLDVSGNKLKQLPLSLGKLDSMTVLLAKSNRLENPPQSICNEGSKATLKYLHKQASPGIPGRPKQDVNIFPRVRGNQLQYSAPNPQSALVEYIQTQTNTTNTPSRIRTPLLPPLEASSLDVHDLRDKIIGVIYGAAIGDAIGIATRNMTPDECRFHYSPDGLCYNEIIRDEHRTHWRQGDWTTNFDQLALLLDSLVHWGGVADELEFAKRLKQWSQGGFKELGDTDGFVASNTISKVVTADSYCLDPHATGQALLQSTGVDNEKDHSDFFADNACLARSTIMGVPRFHDLGEVEGNAVRICRATHADPRCIAGSVLLAVLLALVLQGKHDLDTSEGVEAVVKEAQDAALPHLTDQTHIEQLQQYCQYDNFDSINVHEPGKEDFVFKSLAAGLAALRLQKNYRESIMELVMLGGSSNTHACIAGALLGCRGGYGRLPSQWVTQLRRKETDWLNIKINLLLDMMGLP